jgi:hypothetical protein
MGANRGTVSSTSSAGAPNPAPAPWSGSGLIAFDARPFARSLLHWYTFASLIGYCALIAWAQSQHSAWLVWWLDLWMPVVDVFRDFLPIFDRVDRALAAKGLANRAPVIDHLVAFGWIVTVPIFAFLTWTVWHLSREELIRYASKVPAYRQAIMLFGAYLFFQFGLLWIVLGFGLSENPMFAVHRYDSALPSIGIVFSATLMCGIGLQVSFRGLMVASELEKEQHRRAS